MDIKKILDNSLPSGPLLTLRNTYYRAICNYYELTNRWFRDGIGRWDNIQEISPDSIRYITYNDHHLDYGHGYLNAGAFDIVKRSGARVGGKWDTEAIEFEELYVYSALNNRYYGSTGWEETRYFQEAAELIAEGDGPWGSSSMDDLWNKCNQIDALFEHIQKYGYQSQRSLGKAPVDEITVNIGRDGTVFFNDGRHRLSIAKILGIEKIPVRVLVTHEYFEGVPTLQEYQPTSPVSTPLK